MKAFLLGVVVTVVCAVAAVYIYFAGGFAPVATASAAMPFEKRLANMALHARVSKEMPKTVPLEANEENLLAGAKEYTEHCSMCHGLPNQPPGPFTNMFPKPPQLFKGKGVTDDPPGETYWKIKNGIRLTGMASFYPHLSDTEIWQLSLLLANAHKLPPSVTTALTKPEPPSPEHEHIH